jgi:hypothetical protein
MTDALANVLCDGGLLLPQAITCLSVALAAFRAQTRISSLLSHYCPGDARRLTGINGCNCGLKGALTHEAARVLREIRFPQLTAELQAFEGIGGVSWACGRLPFPEADRALTQKLGVAVAPLKPQSPSAPGSGWPVDEREQP